MESAIHETQVAMVGKPLEELTLIGFALREMWAVIIEWYLLVKM